MIEMIEILQNKNNTEKTEFVARDGESVLGRIAGFLCGDTFVIDELECEDYFTDGLVRAILNLMTLHGIDRAEFKVPGYENTLRKLGFIDDGNRLESIADFFDKKCCGLH